MDVQAIARVGKIMQANRLTDVMVGALLSGKDGEEVQAGPRQIDALVSRELADPETRTLTNRGYVLIKAMEGQDLSEDEEGLVYPSASSGGRKYFILWGEGDPQIRPYSEAGEDDRAVSMAEAKDEIIGYATRRRDHYRDMIKATRSLRAKNLGPDDDAQSLSEPQFSDS